MRFYRRPAHFNYAALAGGATILPTFVSGANVTPLNNAFSAGTKTFTGLNGGVNFPAGSLVIVGVGQDESGVSLSTPLIGGVAATLVPGTQNSTKRVQLYQAVMAASSPDTFSFSNGSAIDTIAIASAYMLGVNSTVSAANTEVWANQSDPQTLPATIAIPTSGFGFVFVCKFHPSNANPSSLSWTNTTAPAGDTFAALVISTGGIVGGGAHSATPGSWNPSVSGVTHNMNFISAICAATWGP